MKLYKRLYNELCSYENLELAFKKARKHKTLKPYVIEFEKNLEENISLLRTELLLRAYRPKPLETFILRDPKTRTISKSAFRDRVVHHAICNIIEPIFDKTFIYDSYANRKGKGTLKAIERFEYFKRKITKNNKTNSFVLKADIKHYFATVDHKILISILQKKIKDNKLINLIKIILNNHQTQQSKKGSENYRVFGLSSQSQKGMPLGNLTSQFFANVYLHELDYYVKYVLRAKYYIRYVDDFIIMDVNKEKLEQYKQNINLFLKENLDLELHPEKTKIHAIKSGTPFLGLRIYPHHRLLAKRNIRKFNKKLEQMIEQCKNKNIEYDKIYDTIEGWIAYAKQANTHKLRTNITNNFETHFAGKMADAEINRWRKISGSSQ